MGATGGAVRVVRDVLVDRAGDVVVRVPLEAERLGVAGGAVRVEEELRVADRLVLVRVGVEELLRVVRLDELRVDPADRPVDAREPLLVVVRLGSAVASSAAEAAPAAGAASAGITAIESQSAIG